MADIARELVRDRVHKEVNRQVAVKALEDQAAIWEKKALDGTYNLQKELQDYYVAKARSARDEAARLKGGNVPDREPRAANEPVTVVLPR